MPATEGTLSPHNANFAYSMTPNILPGLSSNEKRAPYELKKIRNSIRQSLRPPGVGVKQDICRIREVSQAATSGYNSTKTVKRV